MPFDWNMELRETAAHLVSLANTPGFLEHAKERSRALIANPLYGEELEAEIGRVRTEQKEGRADGRTAEDPAA